MKIFFPLLWCLLMMIPSAAQQASSRLWSKDPIQNGFLKNSGQVKNMDNKPVDFVYYQARIGGQQVFITNYGLSVLISRNIKSVRVATLKNTASTSSLIAGHDSGNINTYEMERVDIVLKHAAIRQTNISTVNKKESPLFNMYMNSPDTHIESQQLKSEILVKNVYEGIDWRVYIKEEPGKEPFLKYDFIVHPGADPGQIELQYSDNAKLELQENEIRAKSKMAGFTEEKPYSYLQENNTAIPVSFGLKKNRIHFKTGAYDTKYTLVIDPSIFWLTYLSTTSQVWSLESIYGNDVETDAAGNIFLQLSAFSDQPFPTVNPGNGAYYQSYTASPTVP
jgi:hypothetical protein